MNNDYREFEEKFFKDLQDLLIKYEDSIEPPHIQWVLFMVLAQLSFSCIDQPKEWHRKNLIRLQHGIDMAYETALCAHRKLDKKNYNPDFELPKT